MKYLKQIAYVLLLIGGLNWGVYGISGYNVVDGLLGSVPMFENIVYLLVGISALYIILNRFVFCSCTSCSCSGDTCCSSDCSTKNNQSIEVKVEKTTDTQQN